MVDRPMSAAFPTQRHSLNSTRTIQRAFSRIQNVRIVKIHLGMRDNDELATGSFMKLFDHMKR
jgi:hypothetical protein